MKKNIFFLASFVLLSLSVDILCASNEEDPDVRVAIEPGALALKSCLRTSPREGVKKQVSFAQDILDAPEEKVLSPAYLQVRENTSQNRREKDSLLTPDVVAAKESLLKLKNILFKKNMEIDLSTEEQVFLLTYRAPVSLNSQSPSYLSPRSSKPQSPRRAPSAEFLAERFIKTSPRERKIFVPMSCVSEVDSSLPTEVKPVVLKAQDQGKTLSRSKSRRPLPLNTRRSSPRAPMPILEEEPSSDDFASSSDFSTTEDEGLSLGNQEMNTSCLPVRVFSSKRENFSSCDEEATHFTQKRARGATTTTSMPMTQQEMSSSLLKIDEGQ